MTTDSSESSKCELLDRPLNILNRIICLSRDSNIIVDGSINLHLNIIPRQSFEPVNVDDVSFHIYNVDSVGKGIEVLEARPHCFDVSSETFVNSYVLVILPTKL
jgi:hypothetical protein